jgi:HlyD family secretion protein
MRRVFVLLGILVVGLGVALGWRIYRQDADKLAPSGGTGTVEGVEVDIVSRLSARIRAIQVEEGDSVKAGQLLVELDCDEPMAIRAEAAARVAVAEAAERGAKTTVSATRETARSLDAAAQAARSQAESAKANIAAAKATEEAAAAQKGALAAERVVAKRMAERMIALKRTESGTESDLDTATGREESLSFQEKSAAASIQAAHERAAAAAEAAAAARAQAQAARAQTQAALAQTKGARTQVDVASHSLEAARAALRRAEIAVAECRLTAPRAGVVLTRNFEPGEMVLPGARILTIADLFNLRTTFFIPNANLADAAPGRDVELVADTYPGTVFKGKILSVSSKAEFTPRNIQTREDRDRLVYAVKVAVPNPDGRLRPGMPVEVRIPGTQKVR